MTLEDENRICQRGRMGKRHLPALFRFGKNSNFLGISGTLQAEDNVVHLVAEKLWEPKVELKPIRAPSRDFH